MRRWPQILLMVLAVGLLIAGAWCLTEATHIEGWNAAPPAVIGLGFLITAGAIAGRQAIGLVTYPITALLGSIFHPGTQFTHTPKSQLLVLRTRIAEGRFKSVEHQLAGLLKAYPCDPGLYHVWALLEAAKGRQIQPVTLEASRALSAKSLAEYESLLKSIPPRFGRSTFNS